MANQNPYRGMLNQAADAYGTDSGVLSEMARLESGFRPNAANDWDSNAAAGTPSKGLMQFIKPTFDSYAASAKAANPGAWRGVPVKWMNPKAQALAASWAVANGKGSAWTTYQRALKKAHGSAGVNPRSVGLVAASPTITLPKVAPLSAGNSISGSAFVNAKDPRQQWFADFIDEQSGVERAQHDAAAAAAAAVPQEIVMPQAAAAAAPNNPQSVPKYTGKAGSSWKSIRSQGHKLFGLRNDPGNSQTTGGRHTSGSEHYEGRAVDFGNALNTPQQLAAAQKYFISKGYDVLDEGNHLHVSAPGGGI